MAVERAGPLLGALVVTLPVTVGPAYCFLALDHDAAYLAASAQSGLAVNAASAVFMLAYVLLAQSRGLLVSLSVAVLCWIGVASLVRPVAWSIGGAALLNVVLYGACMALAHRFREARVPRVPRGWYELPLRTALVCALMGTVLALSQWAGPAVTGMLAVFPISTTCTMLIVHTRIGGKASAAVIANGLWGLFGIGAGLFALAVSIGPFGTVAALTLLIVVPMAWNFSMWLARNSKGRLLSARAPRSSVR